MPQIKASLICRGIINYYYTFIVIVINIIKTNPKINGWLIIIHPKVGKHISLSIFVHSF